MAEIKGQINRGSFLGDYIYNLVKQEDIKNILDLGTFNGMGSTKCIYDAILETNKKDFLVYSLECNQQRWLEANNNLKPFSKFYLLYGTAISPEEIEHHKNVDEVKSSNMIHWLNEDLEHMKKCPNYSEKIKNKLWDLVILDGSELSGFEEFNLIKDISKYIILDDTRSYKHKKTREYILNNLDKYTIITDDLKDRGGFLICKVKNV